MLVFSFLNELFVKLECADRGMFYANKVSKTAINLM